MRPRSAQVRLFEQSGFTLIRDRNHQVWRCPCGHTQLVCPSTPGKGRATDNNEARVRRTLRACGQTMKECA